MSKPSIPQGMRDFTSETVRKRNFILQAAKTVFERYGFEPLETPAMENLDTLMGKYGEEGDKLIFKILNNGLNDPKNISKAQEGFDKLLEGRHSASLTERALRYDLTIPFARFVAMNHGQLTFPYKRYQMQPVWRADRPQKGRYREFTQCDADVVGSRSIINEIELANIYHDVFNMIGLTGYRLKVNNRKVLAGLAELAGGAENLIPITISIDKLDKIGLDKVKEELAERGIPAQAISTIEEYLAISGSNVEMMEKANKLFAHVPVAQEGLAELQALLKGTSSLNIDIDFTLARGLNYYTGVIFEAKAPEEVKMGSIGGGGRYDDLTGLFGVKGIPGVGISLGIDRIYDVLDELDLFPKSLQVSTKVLFFNLGQQEQEAAFSALQAIRQAGISAEIFHEVQKLDKQFKYAEKKNIPFVVILGSRELEQGVCMVKELSTGKQEEVKLSDLTGYFTGK